MQRGNFMIQRTTRMLFTVGAVLGMLRGDWSGASTLYAADPALDTLENLGKRRQGSDWPGLLGPHQDGKSPEKGLVSPWPKGGPKVVWQTELGTSYGPPSIAKGRLFLFDRHEDQARLTAYHAETGAFLWKFEYPTEYEDFYGYNNGPRCCPVIDGNRVYVLGVEGMLHCVNATTGKALWKVDTAKDFHVVQNFFGVGSTPVIAGDLLLVQIGGSPPNSPPTISGRVQPNGCGIVAFDKYTGVEKYRLADDLASYSSPVLAVIGDRRWCFVFARNGLVGFDPTNGKLDFHYPWKANLTESVNASNPVVVGDQVLISEAYDPKKGTSVLRVKPGGCEVVWTDSDRARDKSLQTHWSTPIYVDGYVYACSQRHSPQADVRCVDWKTGAVQWKEEDTRWTSLTYVDGHFISLNEYGLLRLLRVNPRKYEVISEVMLQGRAIGAPADAPAVTPLLRHPAWAPPVISHGLLYVRGKDRLVCLDLIPEKP